MHTSSTDKRQQLLLWLVIGAIAVGCVSLSWPGAHVGTEIVPTGNDSFYHARRILDTARDSSSFYQFDPKIHAPEGSLLTWPWGYDYVLGQVVRFGLWTGIVSNPMALLGWIPPATVVISIWLMLLIARRLALPMPLVTLAGLCVALSPLTQFLHAVGRIDHHYAEYIFVLMTLATALRWFANSTEMRSSIALGTVLGVAPAIHNSLFVLQAPFVAAVFASWLAGSSLPARTSLSFAIALCASTLAIVLPSLPFRLGHFEFYTLSWFHLYVASGTAIATLLMARRFTRRNGVIVLIVGVLLLIPLMSQVAISRSFIAGTSTRLDQIFEMRSLLRQIKEPNGIRNVSNLYSAFALLLPLTLLYCMYRAWRDRVQRELVFFWLFSIFGLCLLASQLRMHYFGSFALYLPWLLLATDLNRRWPSRRKVTMLVTSLSVLLLYYYPLRYQLWAPWAPANDHAFVTLRPLLDVLGQECAKQPGIVLADSDAGHYIRYYTDCSVIANNFLLTPQHGRKIEEAERLMSLRAAELIQDPAPITYILVRPLSIVRVASDQLKYVYHGGQSDGLAKDLLLGSASQLPKEYSLIAAINLAHLQNAPYARLYRIERSQAD